MDATICFNTRSGKGGSESTARRLAAALTGRGLAVRLAESPEEGRVNVIVGGDGTIHRALPMLVRSSTAVYHAPTGTANLFAREFGMKAASEAIVDAVRGGLTRMVDVGEAAGTLFAIMVSVGPDAGVVHRLAAVRRGPISMASYLAPAWREFCNPHLPTLTIHADGSEVFHGRGMAVMANIRHYGGGFNPAGRALADDGLLDLAVLPARSGVGVSLRLALCRVRLPWGVVRARASEFTIRAVGPALYQADGEAVTLDGDTVPVRVRPACLRVACPSTWNHGAAHPL